MELIIKLNTANGIPLPSIFETITNEDGTTTEIETKQYDWTQALHMAALEIQALNSYSGTVAFPAKIPCNPDAMILNAETGIWEGDDRLFLGTTNTSPTLDRGMVTVSIPDALYKWLETDLFPQMPTTFCLTVGNAPAGKILS